MKATQFYHLLRHTELLTRIDKPVLDHLVREYPYFHTAYLLIAKKAKLDNESNFESRLNVAAAYAIDRVKLYELINQKISDPAYEGVTEKDIAQGSDQLIGENQELGELLQSIHERKQQVLATEPEKKQEEPKEDEDSPGINELSFAAAEISPLKEELNSETEDGEINLTSEIEVLKKLKEELIEEEEYELNDEFLLVNEVGGGGSEYLPMDEMPGEESEMDFVNELDSELESIRVIEEEFILRDLDIQYKEQEVERISEKEIVPPIESFAEPEEFSQDSELEALRKIEEAIEEQEEYDSQEELLNANEMAGGGSEFVPIEIVEQKDENEPMIIVPAYDQFVEQEEEIQVSAKEIIHSESTEEESFRINEEVTSPGEFLPEKSYTFLEWLRLFRSEPPAKQKSPVEKKLQPIQQSSTENIIETKSDTEKGRRGMQEELEAIEKIVSGSKYEFRTRQDEVFSPEKLAQKSLEMDEDIVSETLARIYEEQGKYNQAIRMYARLSLKFPEKIAFFAARIKELKSKK